MEIPNDKMFYYGMSDFIPLIEEDPPSPQIPSENLRFFETDVVSLRNQTNCPYCGQPLQVEKIPRPFSKDMQTLLTAWNMSSDGNQCSLYHCSSCGWWGVLESGSGDAWYRSHRGGLSRAVTFLDAAHWGTIRAFDVNDAEAPIEHLRGYLRNHPDNLYRISPVAFEKLIASILKDYFNCDAVHVGGPSDNGIDVILVDAEKPVLVQVKRRENSESFENVKLVREILGVMLTEGFYNGLIVSTAKRFSDEAVRMVNLPVLKQRGYKLTLHNYSDVLGILKCTADKEHKPWEQLW